MNRAPKQAPCDQYNIRADELASDPEYYGAPACCQCAECGGTPADDLANGDGDEHWQRIDGVWSHDCCPLDPESKREVEALEIAEAWGFTDEAIGWLKEYAVGSACPIDRVVVHPPCWQHAMDDDWDDHDSPGEPCPADLAESADRVEADNGLIVVHHDQRELWPDQPRLF